MMSFRWKSLFFFVYKSLKKNPFNVCLSAFAVSLSVFLILLVSGLHENSKSSFLLDGLNLNAVVGARSSKTQLVMNAFYQMDVSPGNIPFSYFQRLQKDDGVEIALPFALGDNYYGYRIIGTLDSIFESNILDAGQLKLLQGKKFDSKQRTAVFGYQAAMQLKINVGQKIKSFHGLEFNEKEQHDQDFVVVGILEPTYTPLDRVILIPLDSFYKMDGHVVRKDGKVMDSVEMEEIADEYKEISAVVLKVSAVSVTRLDQQINKQGKAATFATVAGVVPEILEKVGFGVLILKYVSFLVMIVAGIVVLVGIYNGLAQRQHEFAVLRALGASRKFVFLRILVESELLILMGFLMGLMMFLIALFSLRHMLYQEVGIYMTLDKIPSEFIYTPVILFVVGLVAGLIPAYKIYKSDVTKFL